MADPATALREQLEKRHVARTSGIITACQACSTYKPASDELIVVVMWPCDVAKALDLLRRLVGERDEQSAELERERMRLAACGVAALGYHKPDDPMAPEYKSASLDDVFRLQERIQSLEAELERVTALWRDRDRIVAENVRLREQVENAPWKASYMSMRAERDRLAERVAELERGHEDERSDHLKARVAELEKR